MEARLCEGRSCVVTGAGRGIGREHALMLAAHGARVVVNDVGSEREGSGQSLVPAQAVVDEILANGGEAVVHGEDISTWSGAKSLIDTAVNAFGTIDVLVNNAGILRDRMLVNMAEEEWDAVIRVHLKGTFATLHWAAAYWRDRFKAGHPVNARIINTTSISGLYGNVSQGNYGAAKAGIAALTVIAALELGRYGVTVNAIAPGALTRMTEDLSLGRADEQQRAAMAPRWVAPVCTWLASTKSSRVTGRVIESTGKLLAIAESWRRGPSALPVEDPEQVGEIIEELLTTARPNVDMYGNELPNPFAI